MKRIFLLVVAFMLLSSHDLFLKLDQSYFLDPNTPTTLQLYNGTFQKSENVIDSERMIDVSLVGGGQRISLDSSQWVYQDNASLLLFGTGDEGTWVAGVSTRARVAEMTAADFNSYLEDDGLPEVLEQRRQKNQMDEDASEKYSKHVKAIFQVGDKLSQDWKTRLGYPIEFVPLANPYHLHDGEDLPIQLFFQGEPLADQLVYAGTVPTKHEHDHDHDHDHSHGESEEHSHEDHDDHDDDHHHHDEIQLRTDSNGLVMLSSPADGQWYVRTIYLVASEEEGLTHESNWATLSFQVGERHSHGEEDHHTHEEEDVLSGIPSYVFWIISLVIIVGLFFWFNRKNDS